MGTRLLSLMTWTMICAGLALASQEEAVDAREGDEVTLACRAVPAPPGRAAEPLAYYWVRSTQHSQPDNVAVGAVPLQTNYKVVYEPEEGRYDLVISNATYERDNGRFECRVKEHGSGRKMHSQAYQLVVLRPPAPPRLQPGPAVRAREGQDTSLRCETGGGSPEPSVKWYREGSPYPLESNVTAARGAATLVLRPTREDDGARFRCVVWNRALPQGHLLEAAALLHVDYYPRVTVGPSDPLHVELGGSARLECAVDAKPAAGAVRWTRRGRPAPAAADDGALELGRVTADDGGEYVCSADNGLGRAGEARLLLDVQFGPVVALPAASHEAEEGGAVRLPCNVTANPPPRLVEWLKEGDASFRRRGALLELEAVTPAAAGTYTCRATNELARAERSGAASVALLVRHRPGRAVVSPERATAQEGAAVTLTCAADPPGWPQPQYRWFRAPPQPGPAAAVATGAAYSVASAHLGSEGAYYCQAGNELGAGPAGAGQLRVLQPPRFQGKLPALLVRRAGEREHRLACTAQGKPRPRAEWRRGGRPLAGDAGDAALRVETEPLEPLAVRSSLVFPGPLRPQDRGLYTCVFENDVKRIESTVHLKIEHEPILVEQRDRVAVEPGDAAELQCRVLAFPKPDFVWHFGGAPLPPQEQQEAAGEGDEEDVHVSRLRLRAVDEAAYGQYQCRAANGLGAVAAAVLLQRKGPPAAPRLRSVRPRPAGAALHWQPGFDGGLPGTKFFVSYKRAGAGAGGCGGAGDAQWRELDCGRENPCNVTGLDQHQSYLFKVKAVNTKGQSEYSEEMAATTGAGRVPPPDLVTLEPRAGLLAFRAPPSCLPLEARPELAGRAGPTGPAAPHWASLPPRALPPPAAPPQHSFQQLALDPLQIEDATATGEEAGPRLRLRLCLIDAPDICSEYVEAEIGPSYIKEASSLTMPRVAAIVVSCLAFLGFLALLLAFCRCRAARRGKQQPPPAKQPQLPGAAPPPYYPSTGMENSALEHSLELALAMDECKPPYRPDQYYPPHQPNGDWGQLGYAEGYSPLQSARAGSEHSQDSLWQLKQAAGAGAAAGAAAGGGYYEAPHGYPLDDYGPYPAAAPYPPHPPHPPHPPLRADYCADPYASVHKPKKRADQMLESPYHEVSGLPDAGGGGAGGGGGGGAAYDEALESGYSTPNSRARRVIREIIV